MTARGRLLLNRRIIIDWFEPLQFSLQKTRGISPNCTQRMTTVRRLHPAEWQAYRDLRLSALADSPDAFGSTYEHESLRPDGEWKERVELGAGSAHDLPLIAEDGTDLVGLAWGKTMPEEPAIAHLFQMWVAPHWRGQGVGQELLRQVIEWARASGAEAVVLGVTCGNGVAQQLYARAGFVPLGEPAPLRPGSALLSQKMRLDLRAHV
jgi:ribosomal protein S18 acetylase RimI-like enzyme